MIRPVKSGDAKAICGIYNHYVRETVVTFEETPVSIKEMAGRIERIGAKYPWFVMEENEAHSAEWAADKTVPLDISGYAYANTWKERYAYRYAAELSIYLKAGFEGKGRGTELMKTLLEAARKAGLHVLVSGITLPNDRSVALHEKFGFAKTAHFREIGFKQDRWLDVAYWEILL